MGRCTGHCCKEFTLPSYPKIRQRARMGDDDARHVLDLIIPLGGTTHNRSGERIYIYTCKELQPNGDCGIYAERPHMCRDYPYGRPCEQPACTMNAEAA